MINRIIEFSIHNKLIILLFITGLVGYGVYETTQLPIDAVPDITNNQVQIITIAPEYGATDIERLVTFPVEMANSNIEGIQEFRSFSRFGLSLVTIVFKDDVDIHWARQQIAERLQKVQSDIPAGIGQPEMGPITTGLGEIYQYVVRALPGYESRYDITELRTIQDWIVKRQLMGLEGIADVSSFGGKLKQFEVQIDPARLYANDLNIADLAKVIETNNQNTGGAYIERGPSTLFIRSEGLIGSIEDIENLAVKTRADGSVIFMRDVAEVRIGHATRYGAMCYNDEGEVSGAVVMMLKGANSNKVIAKIKERIAEIQKTLPEGVVIDAFLDRTKMVNNAIGTVEKNLLEGALIVVFILVLFLGNIRAGLLVASVIPLSMLFAIIMMNLFGVSGNLMSLGALDFGLIVDGAVIIVEAVLHKLHMKKKDHDAEKITSEEMDSEVKQSASRMMNSAIFGQIIILIVYLPILTLQGIEGKMFKPMAQTVAFALLGAFLLSITYIPVMSSLVLSKKTDVSPTLSDRLMARIENVYQHYLLRALRIPKTLLTIVVVLFASAIFVLSTLGGEFIPSLEEGDFAVDTRVLTGSNLNTTMEYSQKAAGILKSRFPEVEKVVTKIGSGEVPTDPMPMEASDMMVILKDKKEWTSAKTFPELEKKMSDALAEIPGITTGFQYPVQMRFNELMTGARQDVVCKIFGENLDTLAKYAEKLGEMVQRVQGTKDLYVEPVTGLPQVVINYNRAAMARYNCDVSAVNDIVQSAFAGKKTGMVFEGEKRFDLVIKLEDKKRRSVEDIRSLLVPLDGGLQIPLSTLADVEIVNGPNQIQREDAKRRILCGFNIDERDVQSVVNDLQVLEKAELSLPAGYFIRYGGSFENLAAAKKRLGIAVPVSLVLIFILLFFAFGSVKQSLMIYTAIPLSAIGGIWMLFLRDMPFSISAGVGFIALFGVAVLNGIVLISEFNLMKKHGFTNVYRIAATGAKTRLRPVLMTAFVASLGFLPMALSHGAGAEVQRPLATVVIGGLLLATFLTLFILPLFYVLLDKTASTKIHPVKVSATILLLFAVNQVNAQKTITLDAAIDSAFSNNPSIKNYKLQERYNETLIGSSFNLPGTEISSEFGQINSIYSDNRFGLAQSLSFPTVYIQQKKLYTEEWKASVLQTAIARNDVRRNVRELFSTILLLRQKEKLLNEADSLYNNFVIIQDKRLASGEANIIESKTAHLQKDRISVQLTQIRQELELAAMQFQLMIRTGEFYEPSGEALMNLTSIPEEGSLRQQNPALLLNAQLREIESSKIRLQKNQFLPDLKLGVYSMTMLGNGADNVVYGQSSRFNSVQLGLAIPIFGGNNRARLKAARINAEISENNYISTQTEIDRQFIRLKNEYLQYMKLREYQKNNSIPDANMILDAANNKLQRGEINYIEWIVIVNEVFTTKNNFIDLTNNLNQSIIQINYLFNK